MFHTGTLLTFFSYPEFLFSFFAISFGAFQALISCLWSAEARRFDGLPKLGVESFSFKITPIFIFFFWNA